MSLDHNATPCAAAPAHLRRAVAQRPCFLSWESRMRRALGRARVKGALTRSGRRTHAFRLSISGLAASRPPSLSMPRANACGHAFPASHIPQYSRGPHRNRGAWGGASCGLGSGGSARCGSNLSNSSSSSQNVVIPRSNKYGLIRFAQRHSAHSAVDGSIRPSSACPSDAWPTLPATTVW